MQDAAAHDADPGRRAAAQLTAAQQALAKDQGDLAVASALEAARLFTSLHQHQQACEAKVIALRVHMNTNDVAAFDQLAEQLILEGTACGAWAVVADAHNLQGGMQLRRGQLDDAIASLERASTLRRDINDQAGYAGSLNNLGLLHQRAGNAGRAIEYFLECVAFIRASGLSLDRQLGACLINVGALYRSMQLFDQAERYLREGLETVQRTGDPRMELAGQVALADVARDRGDLKGGIAGYLKALALAERLGAREEEAEVLDSLGRIYATLGEDALAAQMSRKALDIASTLQLALVQVWATLSLGHLALKSGDAPAARARYEDAEHHAALAGLKSEVLQAKEGQARASAALGEYQRSAGLFEAVLLAERAGHAEREATQVREHQARFDVERANMEADTQRLLREASERAREDAEAAVQHRTKELEFAQVEVVTRLAAAAEYRDDQTGQHTFRVGHVTAHLAERLGVPAEDVDILRLAARLHDVGKIGIPDAILLKPGRFTPEEFEMMKQHTLIGGHILAGGHSQLLQVAEEIALTHHERWDGRGYPNGLGGEDIPLSGRLVSVADVYDALTSERPYKEAWTPEAALAEIESQAGRQFDPRVVEAFGDMVRSGALERLNAAGGPHRMGPGEPRADQGRAPSAQLTRRAARSRPDGVELRLNLLIQDAWDKRHSNPALAQALTEAAAVLAEEDGDDLARAYVQRHQALTLLEAGDLERAARLLGDVIATARAHADRTLERDGLHLLVDVCSAAGLQEEALQGGMAAADLSAKLGDTVGEAHARTRLGLIQARLKRPEQALQAFEAASQLSAAAGAQGELATSLYHLGDTALDLGNISLAAACADRSLQAAQESAQTDVELLALGLLARAKDNSLLFDEAAALHHQLLSSPHLDRNRTPEAWGWAALSAADNQAARGDAPGARASVDQVVDVAAQHQLLDLEVRAHSRVVELLLTSGDAPGALVQLERERAARERRRSLHHTTEGRGEAIKALVTPVLAV
ncbi:HD domain-containing phosphohydrolase [Deinococcus sonorensis]|uniref:HD domain-containing phosphohydrolase n=2 Tax=Deinococcus sonorensis TaxID=309891 RepID=A0AAU7U660_9DEIO